MTGNCNWRIVTDRRSKAYDHFYVEFKDNIPTKVLLKDCSTRWNSMPDMLVQFRLFDFLRAYITVSVPEMKEFD